MACSNAHIVTPSVISMASVRRLVLPSSILETPLTKQISFIISVLVSSRSTFLYYSRRNCNTFLSDGEDLRIIITIILKIIVHLSARYF